MAHVIGGLEPARTIVLELLESGKDVVTANKALLAEHGPELFDRARQAGPLDRLRGGRGRRHSRSSPPSAECLTANQIESIHAILNGTSNFILTQMEEQRHRLRRRPWPRPSSAATPRPIRPWTSTAATPPRSWPSSPTWPSAPGSTGATSRARASTWSTWPTCATPRNWATASSCWPWPSWCPRGWNCTFRPRWCGTARRWPRSAGPTTPSAWWATPWAGCSSTAWAPARCPPPRPWWPT